MVTKNWYRHIICRGLSYFVVRLVGRILASDRFLRFFGWSVARSMDLSRPESGISRTRSEWSQLHENHIRNHDSNILFLVTKILGNTRFCQTQSRTKRLSENNLFRIPSLNKQHSSEFVIFGSLSNRVEIQEKKWKIFLVYN